MSTSGEGLSKPEVSESGAGRPGRRASVLKAILALAFCGGAIYWLWLSEWRNNHPVLFAAQGLQARSAADRIAAANELGGMGSRYGGEVLLSLIPSLADPDVGVRVAVAKAVGLVGSTAVNREGDANAMSQTWPGLIGLLKDREAEVRGAAATSVGIIAGSASGGSGRGRGAGRAAKKAESGLDLDSAAKEITALIDDRDREVRLSAITTIGFLASKMTEGPPKSLLAAMEDESEAHRAAAVSALVKFRSGLDPWVPTLLKHVEKDERTVREACVAALRAIGPPAITASVAPALIGAIGSRNRDVRLHIVTLLARLAPDPRLAIPALMVVMREPIDSDSRVVDPMSYPTYTRPAQAAMQSLSRLAPKTELAGEVIAALTEIVRSGPAQRKRAAALALSAFGSAAAPKVPVLIAFLKEAEASKGPSRDGVAAAQALGRLAPGTPAASDAVAALTAALSSSERLTREAAIEALVSFGPKAASAIPAIQEIQKKDRDVAVKKAATEALEKLNTPK